MNISFRIIYPEYISNVVIYQEIRRKYTIFVDIFIYLEIIKKIRAMGQQLSGSKYPCFILVFAFLVAFPEMYSSTLDEDDIHIFQGKMENQYNEIADVQQQSFEFDENWMDGYSEGRKNILLWQLHSRNGLMKNKLT